MKLGFCMETALAITCKSLATLRFGQLDFVIKAESKSINEHEAKNIQEHISIYE